MFLNLTSEGRGTWRSELQRFKLKKFVSYLVTECLVYLCVMKQRRMEHCGKCPLFQLIDFQGFSTLTAALWGSLVSLSPPWFYTEAWDALWEGQRERITGAKLIFGSRFPAVAINLYFAELVIEGRILVYIRHPGQYPKVNMCKYIKRLTRKDNKHLFIIRNSYLK